MTDGRTWRVNEREVWQTLCQKRKLAKSLSLWVGKKRGTSMDEFITSTTTPKERLGSIRAIGECIGLVNRGCYLERNPGDVLSLNQRWSGHLLYFKHRAIVRLLVRLLPKRMAALKCWKSFSVHNSLGIFEPLVCHPQGINAIFMEFTHFWRLKELSGDRSNLLVYIWIVFGRWCLVKTQISFGSTHLKHL